MSEVKPDWESAWQGMEPEQPRPRRGSFVIALIAAGFLLLGACALGYYALQLRGAAESALPTPGEQATPGEGEATVAATVEAGSSAIAPTVTLPGAFATPPQPPPTSEAVASRAGAAPIIDGDAADWVDLPAYSSPYVVFTADTWDGTDDLAASWQVAWDDTNLYFIANVADDVHAQNQTGNQAFRGDSIELQIDADRAGDYGPSLSPDDFQISLSPGDFVGIAPSTFRFQGTLDGEMLDAAAPNGIVVAATPNGTGYVLEAGIPWGDLNLTPAPGLIIGLAVNVNDNDHPGTAAQEMMKSSAPNRRFGDPTTWGMLALQ